jgi:predicted regulator of Ras-like GTPase activity (Roadblock/LC7/MglB family)
MAVSDVNVGFILTPEGKGRVVRILDDLAAALPSASAVLIDRAGRIVEVARRPLGVKLDELAALAAGVFASSNALGQSMGEAAFTLEFEHENDQEVLVWPVGERALLVMLVKGLDGAEKLEERMEGLMGKELATVVGMAQEPPRSIPPPRVEAAAMPPSLAERIRELTLLVMGLQAAHAAKFTPDVHLKMLRFREDITRSVGREDWEHAEEHAYAALLWLKTNLPPVPPA